MCHTVCGRKVTLVLLTLVSARSPSAGRLVCMTVTPQGEGWFILRNPKLFLVLSSLWVGRIGLFSLILAVLNVQSVLASV